MDQLRWNRSRTASGGVSLTHQAEELACRFLQPADWELADTPAGQVDFCEPDQFMPLALCIARFEACAFSVANLRFLQQQ